MATAESDRSYLQARMRLREMWPTKWGRWIDRQEHRGAQGMPAPGPAYKGSNKQPVRVVLAALASKEKVLLRGPSLRPHVQELSLSESPRTPTQARPAARIG